MLFNDFKDKIFQTAEQEGFDSCELYFITSEDFNVQMYKEEIDKYSVNDTMGVSFRGIYNGQMGYAYAEVIDEETVDILIQNAKDNASVIEKEASEEIYAGAKNYPQINSHNEEISKIEAVEKINLARKLEKAIYSADERVENTQSCTISTNESYKRIVNSKGMDVSFKSNMLYSVVGVVAKDEKNVNNAFEMQIVKDLNELDVEKLAEEAVKEALSHFNGEPVESGKYKIMFTNKASASLLQTFSSVFSGESAVKGLTLLKDKVGKVIASEKVTINDNPLLEGGISNRPFDDEGYVTINKKIIEDGKLNTLLHNSSTAKKFNVESTGNGTRTSYSSPLSVSASNMYFEKGTKSYDEMLKTLGEGLLITDMQGMHSGASPVTGEFSLGAKGFLIKDGKVVKPVEQITISGNYFELLNDIEEVGNDLRLSSFSGQVQ